MGKKKTPFSFRKKFLTSRKTEMQPIDPSSSANAGRSNPGTGTGTGTGTVLASAPSKSSKKKTGSRLWMSFDIAGQSELIECDKNTIMKRVSIPARDLRILGPVFSHSSNILARERAMVVNLEFIKAIVTAEEVLLLDPLSQEVLPFVDQLRQQLPLKSPFRIHESGPTDMQEKERRSTDGQWLPVPDAAEGLQSELPFEFQVLEIALEVVCSYLDSSVVDLEINAYPILDELARYVSTKNLERVRSLKSHLTRLLARVQKVRDEIEHLLDDNEDMAHLYLTRKQIQIQQFEALAAAGASNSSITFASNLPRAISNIQSNASMITSIHSDDHDVEDLEMLLEAYFMQLDGTRNKILSVREYIDDTEDYVNIQLDNQRNELIQLQLTLTIASFAIALETLVAGAFGMNIPCSLYSVNGAFVPIIGGTTSICFVLFLIILGYARWKKLLGS
ncbi:magnesium transporter MRS2-4 [Magnolia sinica]|uniref:magnesium transporter MRS2-4 n=1 Tax=Magnolia sinica TaxID=86752 RepID=UPI0026596ABC|nr:magnesium transporter MRS2-4 [Magnolia sinica]XP_058089658.1 magnesium transporter MRS2-4 [Magnolia sinica]XP_058089659.1 magnesium transporter MRS2-4 [Magnolia sinica]